MAPRALQPATPKTGRRDAAEALVRCKASGDAQGAAWCYSVLGGAAFALGEYSEASSNFLESVKLFESLDSPFGACHAQVDLGLTRYLEGKLTAALNAYRIALRYQRDYRFTTESADTFDGIAAIAAALNRLDLAAKLSGTAAGWRESNQQEQWSPMPNDFQESAASVRRRLGEPAWFEAYAAGRKLNSEQALGGCTCHGRGVAAQVVWLDRPGDRGPAFGGRWVEQRGDR
jgi:tetratricopeptide (TPR) repeat protein